jgi:integrase
MKMRDEHIIPLSRQAIEIFEEIRPLTGHGRYVFPSVRTHERPMSENTITGALRRLGYTGNEMTAHGFRAMASTRLNESHLFHADAIERQLAHGERDSVRAAYHRAQYLPERVKMMQWWAEYLDALKSGADVIPFKRTG